MTSHLMQMAILALDVYHRGYKQGVDDVPENLGFATVDKARYIAPPLQEAINFFAQTYNLNSGGKAISYRGTDEQLGDIWKPWNKDFGLRSDVDSQTGYGIATSRRLLATSSRASCP